MQNGRRSRRHFVSLYLWMSTVPPFYAGRAGSGGVILAECPLPRWILGGFALAANFRKPPFIPKALAIAAQTERPQRTAGKSALPTSNGPKCCTTDPMTASGKLRRCDAWLDQCPDWAVTVAQAVPVSPAAPAFLIPSLRILCRLRNPSVPCLAALAFAVRQRTAAP